MTTAALAPAITRATDLAELTHRWSPRPGLGTLVAVFLAAPPTVVLLLVLAPPAIGLVVSFAVLLASGAAVAAITIGMVDRGPERDDGSL